MTGRPPSAATAPRLTLRFRIGFPGLASVRRELARHPPASEATPAAGKNTYDFDFERYQWQLK